MKEILEALRTLIFNIIIVIISGYLMVFFDWSFTLSFFVGAFLLLCIWNPTIRR